MRAVIAGAVLLAASGGALAQTLACNPQVPRLDPGAGFVAFGANEQVLARGGNVGPAWEWALGTDTESGPKVQGSLDWISGRSHAWTLVYSAAGAAILEIRDADDRVLSLSYPPGMEAGNALELQVATSPSIGADTTIAATVSSIKGEAASGAISQTGDNQESAQRLYFYYPPMSQGFVAQGAVSLTYASLPTGSRVSFKLRAGTLPCNNQPPTLSIDAPATNALFHAPASITLETAAGDADGTVAQVEYFANGNPIGTASYAPFSLTWTNVAAGVYNLTARATDNAGDRSTSAAVPVLVNAPPTVSLTNPALNGTVKAPASIALSAEVADPDGTIASVAFYYGETPIATLTSAPYNLIWTAVPPGSYSLTARATDDRGAITTSVAVLITVDPAGPAAQALYYIHVDHLNTPRLVADATGTTVWLWHQGEPFGDNVPAENPSGLGTFDLSLRLPGQYFDKETNLHYNYFRDYDPSLGRYVESDPIGLIGGLNTYAYVRNTPITSRDALGLLGSRGNQTYGCGSGASQPWVSNNPLGYPFLDCCNDHDRCYDDCINKPSRAQCDTTFCSCVASKCHRYGRGQKRQCESLARTYCDAVTQHGEDAFNKARSRCPTCK